MHHSFIVYLGMLPSTGKTIIVPTLDGRDICDILRASPLLIPPVKSLVFWGYGSMVAATRCQIWSVAEVRFFPSDLGWL